MEINNILSIVNELSKAINNASDKLKPEIERLKSEISATDLEELKQKQIELNETLAKINSVKNGN